MARASSAPRHAAGQSFERSYAARDCYFGSRPSPWVSELPGNVDGAGRVALDLGCGHGRNALHLARRGFRVVAIDASSAGIRELKRRAEREALPVLAVPGDIRALPLCPSSCDLVVAVTVLGLLAAPELGRLARRLQTALRPGGCLLAEEFSRRDPGCSGRGPASEFAGLVEHFFAPDELAGLFGGLEPLACAEVGVEDRMHGRPHRHALVRYAACKVR